MADKVLGDFSGGISGMLWNTPENSAADIVNMTPWAGRLAASAGFGEFETVDWPFASGNYLVHPGAAPDLLGGLSEAGEDWLIFRRGTGVYALAPYAQITAGKYHLFRIAKRTSATSSDKATVIGDYVYIAPDLPGDSEYVLRWDRKMVFGTCKYESSDTATSLINTLVADPIASHGSEPLTYIKPGMQFQWIDDDGGVDHRYTYSDPVTITHVLPSPAGSQIRVTGTAAPAHPTTGHFIITDIQRIGIPAPLVPPYTAGQGTASLIVNDYYRWCYRYKSSALNIYSLPSPAVTVLIADNSNSRKQIIIPPPPTAYRGDWVSSADYSWGDVVNNTADNPDVAYVCVTPNGVSGIPRLPSDDTAHAYWYPLDSADTVDYLPKCVDQIEIYRAHMPIGTGVWTSYYLVGTIGVETLDPSSTWTIRKAWTTAVTTGPPADAWLDGGESGLVNPRPSTTILPSDAYWHTRPGQLSMVKWVQGRLFASDAVTDGRLRFSTMGYPESFPLVVFTADSNEVYYGGYVDIGQRGEIQAISEEGGSFDVSGISGDNLLIFSTGGVYRFTGTSWADFNLMGGFRYDGCEPRTVVNVGGMTIFKAKRRVYGIEQGSSHPVPLSDVVWPDGRKLSRTWCAAYYDGMYILANEATLPNNNVYAGECFAMNLNSRAWIKFSGQARALCPTHDDSSLLAAVNNDPGIRALYSDDSGLPGTGWKIVTRPELMISSYGGVARKKMVRRIWFAVTGTCAVTPSIYVDGSTTPAWTGAVVSCGPGTTVHMVPIETALAFAPNSGYTLSVGLTGAADVYAMFAEPRIFVDWIRLEVDDLKENKTR